jgi:light-regulated signal transduction histidine kinase (bacteriophytochrome)
MSTATDRSSVDLTNCDAEPIHIPGAILPHGAMVVVDPDTMRINQVAGDTAGLFGFPAAALIGRPLSDLLEPHQIDRLCHLRSTNNLHKPRHLLDPILRVLPDRPIDATVHISGDAVVIEAEDATPDERNAIDPLGCIEEMFDGLADLTSLQAFCQLATERVRAVTGFDRVMVYRFMPDESGWVFAEDRRADLGPLLDHHYPAGDIPLQARALYRVTWLRLIPAVDYDPAPLLPPDNPRSGRPLDMSQAALRDVSPIHREYLRNMGVGASMSISIVHEGKLWGLIACHHERPRRLPLHLRAICEIFGSMFSMQLEGCKRAEQLAAHVASRGLLHTLMNNLALEDDYDTAIIGQMALLRQYIPTERTIGPGPRRGGVAVRVNGKRASLGVVPETGDLEALMDWLGVWMAQSGGIFQTDRLGEVWPPAQAFAAIGSGLLALSISREPQDFILWFRPETVTEVLWAGDPAKQVVSGPDGDRLTPRLSFKAWTETVRGHSDPWPAADQVAASDLRLSLLEVVLRRIEAASREQARAREQERLLMAELDHRVKNTLANIQALVTQTGHDAASLTGFVESLDKRIQAMSRAHSLLTQSRWQGVAIGSLLHDELDQYGAARSTITHGGHNAVLTPKAALALSLAIHELATNAAKYGAFSAMDGHVTVGWRAAFDGGLRIVWTEQGGPPVLPPKRRGFGTVLIERALALETGGRSEIFFRPDGVVCEVDLPPAAVQLVDTPSGIATPLPPAAPPRVPARRVLVVEDSAMVIMMLERVIGRMGWKIVGPAMRVADAVIMARTEAFDVALLDINLDGEMSWDVAAAVEARGIPFAFSTGYDSTSVMPPRFAGHTVLNKPFRNAALEKTLNDLTEQI